MANFRIKDGLVVGNVVIDAATSTITGTSNVSLGNIEVVNSTISNTTTNGNITITPNGTGSVDVDSSKIINVADPTSAQDAATKSYIDTAISALSSTTITEGDSSVIVSDTGTGTITLTADAGTVASFAAAATTITASGAINLTAGTDVVIPANVGVTFGSGEKIEGDNTDLTVTSGAKINLTAGTDVQIPNNVGVLFGTGGEKIESDGTDLTITSTGALQLTVTGTTTVSGALTVTGDLTVNGTTTTVNSTNTTLDDNLLELNSGAASNANDSGIIIERGSTGDNAIFMWDESADKFTLGTTTATASSTGNITISTGTLVANLEGAVTGNASTATTLETARTIGGVSFNGSANINLPGVNTTGNQDTSGNAATATTATNVTCTANNTTNETVYITFVDGATGTQGIETDTNLSYNPSTNVLTTTATTARYADIAERYESDEVMDFGTVVSIGGDKEITATDSDMSDTVFGVISKQPAYMMNTDAGDDSTHPFVAISGRTPVKVTGSIMKGQRLVSSSIKGVARAVTESDTISSFNVIGRALESKTNEDIGMVECVVLMNK